MRTQPLRRLLDPTRPLTYGIVQAGENVPDGVPYIRPTDMTDRSGVRSEAELLRTDPSIARQYSRSEVAAGDLVLSIGPSYGKVMLVPESLSGANLTQGTARLATGSLLDARWLYWYVQSNVAREFWDVGVSGATFAALNLGPLGETPTPILALEEQRRIADFLDDQVARIDRIIEVRQQQRLLLGEARAALLDEKMCDGETARVQLRRVLVRQPDYGAGEAAEFDEPGWPRYIRTTDVTPEGELRSETFRSLPPDIARQYLLQDGDLLFTRSGATVGKSFIYRADWGPAAFAGYLIRVRVDRRAVRPEWVRYFSETPTYWRQIAQSSIQATIPNVNAEKYASLQIPLPGVEEQDRLLGEFQEVVRTDREAASRMREAMSLLQELKRSLITAAVTGEFDVSSASGVA